MTSLTDFKPDVVTPPGDTLQETIDDLGMTQIELAERTGLSKKTINRIVAGEEPVSQSTAQSFERVLRIPARFWLNLEALHQEHNAKLAEQERMATYEDWARSFPYPEMARRGLVAETSKAKEKAVHLLEFFGVNSPARWEALYARMELEVDFRRSPHVSKKLSGLSVWLRQGERLADKQRTANFDPVRFRTALEEARGLTRTAPRAFVPTICTMFAKAGVVYILIPEFPGLGISGIVRWFHGRPVIQQSLLFKSNDHYWFNLFHEGKHVLQNRKKSIFVEGDKASPEDEERENDADRFARDLLIPPDKWRAFLARRQTSASAICAFADQLEIHPGIIVGRLMREKIIDYGHPVGKLKAKFLWIPPSGNRK